VDSTPNLGLPYIMAAQSQKHVTHNEAIRALDAVARIGTALDGEDNSGSYAAALRAASAAWRMAAMFAA
jgi:hypothetical protein